MNPLSFKPTAKDLKDLQETDLSGKVILVLNACLSIASRSSVLLSSCGGQLILLESSQRKHHLEGIVLRCNQTAKHGKKWQCMNGHWQRLQQATSFIYDSIHDIEKIVSEISGTFQRIDFIFFHPESSEISAEARIQSSNISTSTLLSQLDKLHHQDLFLFTKLLQCSLPLLESTSGSVALLTTSNGSVKPEMNNLPIALLNTSLSMFVRCLSLELGPKNIRINNINYFMLEEKGKPDIQGLEVNQSMVDQFAEKLSQNDKQLSSEDVSFAVLHLASRKRSQFLNGINLIVDNANSLK